MHLRNDDQGFINSEILYTEDFYKELMAMIDKHPHLCSGCGVADGEREYLSGKQRKRPAMVRLCLIDRRGPANDPTNVAMYCTRCRKPDPVWRQSRRLKPTELPQLEFPYPVLEFSCIGWRMRSFELEFLEKLAA